jgi:predicted AlkP superfamily pyrophosphatase or phosphodiesterase
MRLIRRSLSVLILSVTLVAPLGLAVRAQDAGRPAAGPASPGADIRLKPNATTDQDIRPKPNATTVRDARPKPDATTGQVPRPTPKLVVILVVDQMRADYVEKFGSHWTAGFRRLMSEGAWFREAAYPYLTTVTCAGHSSIVTGSLPATHGIIANSWFDRETGKALNCVADSDQSLVTYGEPVKGGTSTKNLRVPTLSDEMRAQMRVAPRVVTISLKDYTATTMAGRHAEAATWFSPSAHSWLTTTAFTKAPVPFIADFIKAHPIDADFGKTWTKLLPESAYQYDDDAVGENTETWTRTFPHVLKGKAGDKPDTDFYVQWDTSPYSDTYLGAMAEYAVDALKLGRGAGTDYLAVSFSALDIVGHAFGPRSHEIQDVLARLDLTLGSLLAHLDRTVGRGNYTLALTADHGVAPIPEQMTALGITAGRIVNPDLIARIDKALEPTLGPGKHVARIVYNDLYFVAGDWAKIQANPEAMRAVLDAVRATPGIARVFRGDQLADPSASSEDRLERAATWSYFAGRSGDLVLIPRPYWLYAGSAAVAVGTGHGTAYDYDQHVPMFLLGQGIKPGQYLSAATPVDIAPTLAFLCGITLSAADGRVLNEALSR